MIEYNLPLMAKLYYHLFGEQETAVTLLLSKKDINLLLLVRI